jgi:6-phosphogluconolactonase (cycloisomerase 2 family)
MKTYNKLKGILALLCIILLFGSCSGRVQEDLVMLVGTYTDGSSKGIYSYRFNQQTGKATPLDTLEMRNPSYLTISDDSRLVYAVSETNDERASLNVIGLNKDGNMMLLNTALTESADPCYVAENGQIAVTANYSGGSMSVFDLDGTTATLTDKFFGETGGPDLSRQETPHVHCSCFTPDGAYVLATDFSADRILSYRLEGGKLIEFGVAAGVSADSGPRHLVFNRDGRFAYLMSELSGKVTAFRYEKGRLESIQEIVSDSVGGRGGADIHLSPDGRFLYSSNRLKEEGIAIFSVDNKTGLLTRIGYQPTGAHPRQFNITPNGRFLLCCCRDSDKIQVFRRDTETGMLTDIYQDIPVSKAVCVQFGFVKDE